MPAEFRELDIPGSFEITPRQFPDDRGLFLESFRCDELESVIGHRFVVAQGNTSVSGQGVVRGIHYADVPPGQAKYVTCVRGAVLDFVIDIRVGSETFGSWDSVVLDDIDRKAVYIPEGLGHCFVALSDEAIVTYLVSAVFNAPVEHAINPLDPQLGLRFPPDLGEPILSPKDVAAPSLAEALEAGTLPMMADLELFHASQRTQ